MYLYRPVCGQHGERTGETYIRRLPCTLTRHTVVTLPCMNVVEPAMVSRAAEWTWPPPAPTGSWEGMYLYSRVDSWFVVCANAADWRGIRTNPALTDLQATLKLNASLGDQEPWLNILVENGMTGAGAKPILSRYLLGARGPKKAIEVCRASNRSQYGFVQDHRGYLGCPSHNRASITSVRHYRGKIISCALH